MEYTNLGRTGLRVSRLALGCMSFGDPKRGLHSWTLDDDAAAPLLRQAVELGITFWDTANVYQQGTSEEIIGRAMRRFSRRAPEGARLDSTVPVGSPHEAATVPRTRRQ